MLQDLHEKIMKKPKAYRKKLAFVLTLFIGLIIITLWLFITVNSLRDQFGNNSPQETFEQNIPSLQEKYQAEVDKNEELQKEMENLGY